MGLVSEHWKNAKTTVMCKHGQCDLVVEERFRDKILKFMYFML